MWSMLASPSWRRNDRPRLYYLIRWSESSLCSLADSDAVAAVAWSDQETDPPLLVWIVSTFDAVFDPL